MSKIPTAEEFLIAGNYPNSIYGQELDEALIKFAKIHVEAALEARDRLYQTHFNEINWTKENKNFIKKSYPLENIK